MCFGDFSVQYSKHSGCTYLQFSVSVLVMYSRFLQTCLRRGFTFTFIVRIIVQFLYQDGHVQRKKIEIERARKN